MRRRRNRSPRVGVSVRSRSDGWLLLCARRRVGREATQRNGGRERLPVCVVSNHPAPAREGRSGGTTSAMRRERPALVSAVVARRNRHCARSPERVGVRFRSRSCGWLRRSAPQREASSIAGLRRFEPLRSGSRRPFGRHDVSDESRTPSPGLDGRGPKEPAPLEAAGEGRRQVPLAVVWLAAPISPSARGLLAGVKRRDFGKNRSDCRFA